MRCDRVNEGHGPEPVRRGRRAQRLLHLHPNPTRTPPEPHPAAGLPALSSPPLPRDPPPGSPGRLLCGPRPAACGQPPVCSELTPGPREGAVPTRAPRAEPRAPGRRHRRRNEPLGIGAAHLRGAGPGRALSRGRSPAPPLREAGSRGSEPPGTPERPPRSSLKASPGSTRGHRHLLLPPTSRSPAGAAASLSRLRPLLPAWLLRRPTSPPSALLLGPARSSKSPVPEPRPFRQPLGTTRLGPGPAPPHPDHPPRPPGPRPGRPAPRGAL